MTKIAKHPASKSKGAAPKKAAATTKRAPKDAATGAKTPHPPRTERPRDPRLPKAGTVLQRPWHGKVVEIEIGERDFNCGGKTYASLSALARAVTGASSINGYAWAGLARPAATTAAPAPGEKGAR